MKLKLTDERRESIAEALRGFMPELDEAAVQRALFAIWPPRFRGEVCSICGVDLKTRPVLSEVTNSAHSKARAAASRDLWQGRPDRPDCLDLPPKTVKRHVHKKPFQVVVSVRLEGSHGQGFTPKEMPEGALFRLCMKCLGQVQP